MALITLIREDNGKNKILIKDDSHVEEVNNEILLEVNSSVEENSLELRIALALLDRIMENNSNEAMKDKPKKEFVYELENLMNCIRFEVTNLKDIFNDNKDNLDIAMTFRKAIKFKETFKNLIIKYMDFTGDTELKIKIIEEPSVKDKPSTSSSTNEQDGSTCKTDVNEKANVFNKFKNKYKGYFESISI